MILYMAVDNSEEELPMAVADTQKELAEMLGLHYCYINKLIKGRYKKKTKPKFRIIIIDVDLDKD